MISGRLGSASIGVVTMTVQEFEAALVALPTNRNFPGTPYYVSNPEQLRHEIVLRKVGDRGNLPAGEAIGEMMEDFRPDFMLLVGTAGGVSTRDDTALGDVIIADYIFYTEFQKRVGGEVLTRHLPYDQPSLYLRESFAEPMTQELEPEWVDIISAERPHPGTPKAKVGHIAAGEKFLGDPNDTYLQEMLNLYDKAVAVDMESGGFARGIFKARNSVYYNPQYLVLRGISDLVDKPHPDKNIGGRWRKYAAAAAASFAAVLAGRLLSTPISRDQRVSPETKSSLTRGPDRRIFGVRAFLEKFTGKRGGQE